MSGANFASDAIVWLRGTHTRGTLLSYDPSELHVELPAGTPAGSHTVVVSSPLAGGNESGAGATSLEVLPPSGFDPSRTFYVTSYGRVEALYVPDAPLDEGVHQHVLLFTGEVELRRRILGLDACIERYDVLNKGPLKV